MRPPLGGLLFCSINAGNLAIFAAKLAPMSSGNEAARSGGRALNKSDTLGVYLPLAQKYRNQSHAAVANYREHCQRSDPVWRIGQSPKLSVVRAL
jgi:hypothetical protein